MSSFYKNKQDLIIYLCLISCSIILGIVAIIFLPPFPVISDSLDYDQIGVHIQSTLEYTTISAQEVIYPPLYPIFLAIIYSVFGHSYKIVFGLQFLLLGLISITIFKISKEFLNLSNFLSCLSAVTVIFWPYFILYSLLISSEILFTFFLILYIYLTFCFFQKPTFTLALTSAICIGLAVLTRPVALLLPIWLGLFILLINLVKNNPFNLNTNHIKNGVLGLFLFIIVLTPWIAYVYIKYDRLMPVASNLTYVFNKANKTLEYLDTNTNSNNQTANLKQVLQAKISNVYLFWNPGASGYNVELLIKNHPKLNILLLLYKFGFYIIILSGLACIANFWKQPILTISLILIMYFWILHTVLFPFPRYTLPIIPVVVVLAFYSWNIMIKHYTHAYK